MICADHWPDLCTRPGGHPVAMTPTLSQLARSGTRFSRAYSTCPSCIPARKSLMTGLTARAHGDRVYTDGVEWPRVKTLAECFHDAGYQSYAVGKLHVWPQRDRLGFDDVLLEEQGRHQHRAVPDGAADDWELYLQERGWAGQEYAGGMSHNDFVARPWHLPEEAHPINWAVREMCRAIRRRDPRRPGFWYLSFSAPHPPLTPLQSYLDLYRDVETDAPVIGDWARRFDDLPPYLKERAWPSALNGATPAEIALARRAFYATLTHLDHQIRVVIGYLREAALLDNTILVFTSDHGHMLGEHGLWCMTPLYEMSARIPLFILPVRGDARLPAGRVDDRFAEFGDIMPTLLDLAGIPIPSHVNQRSLVSGARREHLYGEHGEGPRAQRMIRRGRYKLLYYPAGNVTQLFDIESDPRERTNLVSDPAFRGEVEALTALLVENAYGNDVEWIREGRPVGLPTPPFVGGDIRGLSGQRGLRFM